MAVTERRTIPVPDKGPDDHQIEQAVDALRQALRSLRYGSFSLTVHDGRIFHLDVTEKRRQ